MTDFRLLRQAPLLKKTATPTKMQEEPPKGMDVGAFSLVQRGGNSAEAFTKQI